MLLFGQVLGPPPFEFKGFLQFGRVDEILWSSGGNFRGKKVLQAREVRRGAADIESLSHPPAGIELDARDALEDVDSVGYHPDDHSESVPSQGTGWVST